MLTYADVCTSLGWWSLGDAKYFLGNYSNSMLTYADLGWRMLTCADVCSSLGWWSLGDAKYFFGNYSRERVRWGGACDEQV